MSNVLSEKSYSSFHTFQVLYLIWWFLTDSWQTLFFNHPSLDWTLSDLSKSNPTVSLDKPMGQLWATYSLFFEAQSMTNSVKSLGIVWKIWHWYVPQRIRSLITLRTSPGQCFSNNPLSLSTVCTRLFTAAAEHFQNIFFKSYKRCP